MLRRLTPVDVVESVPSISLNYTAGQPGSYFTVTGENFPPASPMTVAVNDQVLSDELQTNAMGGFIFFLDTGSAEEAFYRVAVSVNPSATAMILLQPGSPLRVQEGGGTTLVVPPGLGLPIRRAYLPVIMR
jgi:hypothetical protein